MIGIWRGQSADQVVRPAKPSCPRSHWRDAIDRPCAVEITGLRRGGASQMKGTKDAFRLKAGKSLSQLLQNLRSNAAARRHRPGPFQATIFAKAFEGIGARVNGEKRPKARRNLSGCLGRNSRQICRQVDARSAFSRYAADRLPRDARSRRSRRR